MNSVLSFVGSAFHHLSVDPEVLQLRTKCKTPQFDLAFLKHFFIHTTHPLFLSVMGMHEYLEAMPFLLQAETEGGSVSIFGYMGVAHITMEM